MIIKYKEYTLEPEGRCYNLYKTKTAHKKSTGHAYLTDDVIGYGMRFETCIEHIAKDIMSDIKETKSLKQYIEQYRLLRAEILNSIEK